MKKLLLVSMVFILLTLSVPLVSAIAASNEINVVINGEVQQFNAAPVNVNGSVLVPMRAIFEKLSATIAWDGTKQQVTATYDSKAIILTINSKVAIIDDKEVELNVAPQIINGNTLVPLRFVGEALDCDVEWNSTTSTVEIKRSVSVTDDKPATNDTSKNTNTPTKIDTDEDQVKAVIQIYVDNFNNKDAKGLVSLFEKQYETEDQMKDYFKKNNITYTIDSVDDIKVNGNEATVKLIEIIEKKERTNDGLEYISMKSKDTLNVSLVKINNIWKLRTFKIVNKEQISTQVENDLTFEIYNLESKNVQFREMEHVSSVVNTLHPDNPAYMEDWATQFDKESFKYEIVGFKVLEHTNDDAKAEVVTLHKKIKDSEPNVFEWIEKQTAIVEYKKTADGWKIYGREITKTESVSGT